MASSYFGKLVELRTCDGQYSGIVESVENGKVMLTEVTYMEPNGGVSQLPRIRINRSDLIDDSIVVKNGDRGEASANDPIAMYNRSEQQLLSQTHSSSFSSVNRRGHYRSSHSNRPPFAMREQPERYTDNNIGPNYVLPANNVFEFEEKYHETPLLMVETPRDMSHYHHYCVLDDEQTYLEAVRLIKSSSLVAVGVFGSPLCRTSRPSWITVSTPRGVFVFDVRFMDANRMRSCGLAEFLSSPNNQSPRKIMHDSRHAADSLKHCFNIDLDIYCDTLALKSSIFIRETNGKVPRTAWSLIDLLYEYSPQGKDLDLIAYRYHYLSSGSDAWNWRPARWSVIHLAAALTVHLCDLYEVLIKALMEPVLLNTNVMLNAFRNNSNSPSMTETAILQMPDGIAETAGPDCQFVRNPTGRWLPDAANVYRNGLIRCELGSFVASKSAGVFANDL